MAFFDPETERLCLQVVYDGAPFSGKTSSALSLGRLLDSPVDSPREEEGRTLFFDWLDYAGGRCLGRPLQCRVLTVPGQAESEARRRLILSAADTVIFVVDTSAGSFEQSRERFASLRQLLERRLHPPPVLLQLNKRDAADALPVEQVLESLDPTLTSVETVATADQGVRGAFVLAVGASVRLLRESGRLYEFRSKSTDTQEIQLPKKEELLEMLERV